MNATILKNGFLKITADNEDRSELAYAYRGETGAPGGYPAADDYVREALYQAGWEFVRPETVAALTDAPIITNDMQVDDNGDVVHVGDVWWFPGYMITDPWQELKNHGRVIFDPEENNKSLPPRVYHCFRCGKEQASPAYCPECKAIIRAAKKGIKRLAHISAGYHPGSLSDPRD